MKNNWQIKKISDVARVYSGNSINAKLKMERFLGYRGGLPYIATKDVGFNGVVNYENGVRIPFSEKDYKIAHTKTTLICAEGGSAGRKLAFLSHDVCFVNKLFALESTGLIESKYIYYYLRSVTFKEDFNKRMSGIIGGVSLSKFKEIKISYPESLTEQKRIVKMLDNIFKKTSEVNNKVEMNLQNSKDFFESYLQMMLLQNNEEWNRKTLKEISIDFGRGKSKHRPRNDKKLYGGEYPFIQTGDVRNSDHYITKYTKTYNEVGLSQSKLWKKGTICITIAANIAETGILDFDACFPDSIIGLVVDPKKADVDFMEYLLQAYQSVLKAKGKGSAQDNINMGTFENELFAIPSLSEQKKIVKKLHVVFTQSKNLGNIYKRKLVIFPELEKSLLSKSLVN